MTVFTIIRFLIGIALIFLPFTQLRFGVIGIGELLLILSMALFLIASSFTFARSPLDIFSLYFWAPILLLLFIGTSYNIIFLNFSTGTFEGALFDFSSYTFIFFMLLILGDSRIYGSNGPMNFYFKIFSAIVCILIITFILSFYASSIFGLKLKYEKFFAPMVDNVHQTAMLFCVLPFIGMAFLKTNRTKFEKFFIICSFPFLSAMAISSGTTKSILGIIVGLSVAIIASIISILSRRNTLITVSVYCAIFLLILLTLFTQGYMSIFTDLFNEYDGNGARGKIYFLGLEKFLENPFFGYGPGSHLAVFGAENSFSDAHNTFLTLAIQSGIFGVLLLLLLLARLIFENIHEPWLLAAIAAFAIYLTGGDILRRGPMWIMLITIVFISEYKKLSFQKLKE